MIVEGKRNKTMTRFRWYVSEKYPVSTRKSWLEEIHVKSHDRCIPQTILTDGSRAKREQAKLTKNYPESSHPFFRLSLNIALLGTVQERQIRIRRPRASSSSLAVDDSCGAIFSSCMRHTRMHAVWPSLARDVHAAAPLLPKCSMQSENMDESHRRGWWWTLDMREDGNWEESLGETTNFILFAACKWID